MSKIKILHLNKSMNIGGIESYIINMNRRIDRDKYQFDYFLWDDGISYYEKEIKELGGNIYRIKYSRNPIKNMYRLYSFLKNNHYDVVHSHSLFYTGLYAYTCHLAKIKIFISHFHSKSDNKKDNLLRKIYKKITRYFMEKYSTYCCACSEEAAKYGFNSNDNVIILNDYIDVDNYLHISENVKTIKTKYDLKKYDLLLGTVGRLTQEKNQEFIIELVKKMIDNNIKKNIKCIIVGDGPNKEKLIDLISKYKLTDKFIFVGEVSNVNDYLKCMDIFLFPSKYEGFGMALLESQAAGVYCIASDQVPKNTDMNLGLVEYLPLDRINIWIEKIVKYKKKNIQNSIIKERISAKGFDINTSLNIIEMIYKGEYKNEK